MEHIQGSGRIDRRYGFCRSARNSVRHHAKPELHDADDFGARLLVGIEGEAKTPADVLYFPKPRNEDVRYGDRLDKRHFHGCLPTQRGGCYSLPPQAQAASGKALSSRAFQQSFTLRSAYPQRIINDCNEGVKPSRSAFISPHACTANDSWRGKI